MAQVYNLYKDKYNNDTITKREFEKKQWSCEIQRKKSMYLMLKKNQATFPIL